MNYMEMCPICGEKCRIDAKGRVRSTCGKHSCIAEIIRISSKNPDRCKKISKTLTGKHKSEEARKKMSDAKIGTHQSEYTRLKRSQALKGIKRSEETRKKMSIAMRMRIAEGKGGYPGHVSKGEKQVVEFIKSIYSGTILLNHRKLLGGYELDVYLPDISLAFEYNGEYWHSLQNMVERDAWKRRECRKRKIALLDIWEKDWKERPDYIKGFISALINNEQLYSFVHP